ncbi:outer membrane beta-barrel protein [Waterburya agarophytonicola K14]|uniref:Outer membrane beta-barrel protein n=1 Tax=Waterburya agarophytonicola KI4 TaxID=2874699 RepID=A0A964BSB8_9CYAN|nr:outer membrane beta-barrel protein [Waterburya agarophytonicola]MCC0178560.1 outer membrane beta-barrel protein [Waterburya agarophytonicola KI4]
MKNTLLATLVALSIPCAVQAQNIEDYKVSCEAEAACNTFDVTYEETGEEVAQTRRTRRTRSTSQGLFKDNFVGGGAGIFFGDGLDLGVLGHVFAGTRYNEYIGGEIEFTFGFAGTDSFGGFLGDTETATFLGFYFNPRFEYKFKNSNITAFVAPGIGLSRFSVGNDFVDVSDTDFDFQIKAGAMFPIGEKLNAYGQGRIQNTFDTFGVDGGILFNL